MHVMFCVRCGSREEFRVAMDARNAANNHNHTVHKGQRIASTEIGDSKKK